jgi:hypothetical protein
MVFAALLGGGLTGPQARAAATDPNATTHVTVPVPPANPSSEPKPTQGLTPVGQDMKGPEAAPEPPKFDPNSQDGAQDYNEIYTHHDDPKPAAAKVPLPRHTAVVGDFDRDSVRVQISGQWYRLPRTLFGRMTDIEPGTKVVVKMTDAQLKQYLLPPARPLPKVRGGR